MNVMLNNCKQVLLCSAFMMCCNKSNENKDDNQVAGLEQMLQGRDEDIKKLNFESIAVHDINTFYKDTVANSDTINRIKDKKDLADDNEKNNDKQKKINENKENVNAGIRYQITCRKNENEKLKEDNQTKMGKHSANSERLKAIQNDIKATEILINKAKEDNITQTGNFLKTASENQAAELEKEQRQNELVSKQKDKDKIEIEQNKTDHIVIEVGKLPK